ncbi:cystine transport system substrate-binding protein [Weissella uvarum]|uniref:transporter substrate-binding domain-containing protein n=1 Tax=Weissella uvarum TaxID=1479233 RepID=UPI001960B803|nr:transporter substrate-binding domain-containing protein [Weissella uvarum]MBM7617908.1 cystine transport system substrate-binding protein [Weissella uvarum]MCM0596095.1 transporter substrate-binding domain-containing protein [Weissella uvarum]
MKKNTVVLLATSFVLVLVGSGVVVNQLNKESKGSRKELRVGLEGTYAPFSYKDKSGKLVGYDVEVANAVAKKMGLKPVFVETKFDSLAAGLDVGKYDVVYNDMTATKEREKHYRFGRPYLKSDAVMIVKKNSPIKTVNDLQGARAAQTTSSAYGQSALKYGAALISSPGFSETLDLVGSGKADVTLNSEDAWITYQKKHQTNKLKAIHTNELEPILARPMFSKKHNDKELEKQVSDAQVKLAQDGTLKRLSNKYFGKDLTRQIGE